MWKLLVPVLMLSNPCRGVNTSCQIPAVEEGQDTTLTCSFSDDVSKLQRDFKVHFYRHNTTALQGNVLDCIWLYGQPECKVHDCCQYDNHVSNTLQIRVLNVTQHLVGRYVCFVLPAGQESYQFCNLTIKESISVKESKDNPHILAALVVIVVIIIVIVIIVFVFLIWRRTKNSRNNSHPDARRGCHINLCRKNSAKVNNDCDQLLPVDAESNSPKLSSDISSKSEGQHTQRIHEPEMAPLIPNLEHEDELTHECEAYPNNRNAIKAHRDKERNLTQHEVPAEDSVVQNTIGQENITSEGKEVQNAITQESLIPEGKEVKNAAHEGRYVQSAIVQESVIPKGKEVQSATPERKEIQSAIVQESVIPEGKEVKSAIDQESVIFEGNEVHSATPEGKEVQSAIVQESVTPVGKEVQSAIVQESASPEGKEVKSADVLESLIPEEKEVKSAIDQESVICEGNEVHSATPEGKEVQSAIVQESVTPEGKEVQSAIVQESVTPEGKEVKSAIVQESVTPQGKEVKSAIVQESVIPDGNEVQNAIFQESVSPEGKEVQHTIAGSTTASSDTHKPSGGKRGPPIVATEKGTITHVFMQPIDVRPFNSSGKKKLRLSSKSKMPKEGVVYPSIIISEKYNEAQLPSPTLNIPSSTDVADDKDNEELSNRSSRYKNDIKGKVAEEEKQKPSKAYKEKTDLKTDPAEKAETKREKKDRKNSERKEEKERKIKEKAEQKKNEERKKMEAKEKKDKKKSGKLGKVENNKEANESVEGKRK